ncbi:MAG: glycosyltransferase family 2 protein [Curvibacter sp.]|nr:glycosyltransferase family 2 protein [Curvibacter sp.]
MNAAATDHSVPSLHIFILCHNRPDDARQAIASVLAQTDSHYALTISDNSSDDRVAQMVHQHFPAIDYVRRVPMLTVQQHINRCVDDAQHSDYFCLFHDDDLMDPSYVAAMRAAAKAHPLAIAIGCNARIEASGVIEARLFFQGRHAQERIRSARDLTYRYYARAQSGFAPFPGYVYNCALVSTERLPLDGGKYVDATWLISLAERGEIVWLRDPLMTYRLHGGNDGLKESRKDRLRAMAQLKRNRSRWGKGLIEDYRCSFIYKPLLRGAAPSSPARRQLAAAFLRRYRWARYLRLDTYRSLLRRALVKWARQP